MSIASRPAPWRRIDEAHRLVAWSPAQGAALARLLEGVQRAWRADWGLSDAPDAATCECASADDLAQAWQFAGAGGTGAVWIALPSTFDDDLACALWGADTPVGPVARRIGAACHADLQGRLRAALHVAPANGPGPAMPQACGPWSGFVCATGGAGVRLLLDAAAMDQALRSGTGEPARRTWPAPTPAKLSPVTTALAGVRLALQARLADGELDLASLQDLRVGDVVRLPHRLDAPLLVLDAQEEVVFTGHLARQGRRKALELSRPAATQPR